METNKDSSIREESESSPEPTTSSPILNEFVQDDHLKTQILSLIPLTDDDPEISLIAERVFEFVSFPTGEFMCFEPDCYSLISRHFKIFGKRDACTAVAGLRENKNPYAPVVYSAEEVGLLVEIGHARIMKYSSEPSSEAICREIVGDEKFKEIDERLIKRARSAAIGRKRKEMSKEFADIPKPKRPHIPDEEIEVTDEDIIETMGHFVSKHDKKPFTPLVSISDALVPADTSCFVNTEEFGRKNIVYKNLWKRGFYLSSGFKFGCDYLVYDGKPGEVHSSYLCYVKPASNNLNLEWMQLHGRIARSVKKLMLIAFVNELGEIYYQTQSYWNEASMGRGAPKKPKQFSQKFIDEIIDKNKKDTATCWEDFEK